MFVGATERYRDIFNILNALHPQEGAELDALMFVALKQVLLLCDQCEDYVGAINVLKSQVDPYISGTRMHRHRYILLVQN